MTSPSLIDVDKSPDPLPHHGRCEGAIVAGGDYRGLGVVRSLGRRGIPVWVLSHGGHLVGAASRYASRTLNWPLEGEEEQLEFLLTLARTENVSGWALFPTCDEDVVLFARYHDLLSKHYCVTSAPWETVRNLCDKQLLYDLGRKLALDVPWSICPQDRTELASAAIPFPVVLKPTIHLGFSRLDAAKAWRCENRESLLAAYDKASGMVGGRRLIVQELVPGWGEAQFSFAALCKDGIDIASVLARRTRQFPMDFGRFSTFVETVDEPDVIEPSRRLLRKLRLTGLVEIEFKRDTRDGRMKLLDVNPRVWGWHTLSRRAGVDFPYLLWRLMTAQPLDEVRGRTGECWMRLCTDLPMAVCEILNRRLSPAKYLRSLLRPKEPAVFALDDPLPGLFELPLMIAMLGRRFLRGDGI